MNFAELRTQFEGLLKRRDLTTTMRDGWLNAAIDDVEEIVRVPPMIASVLAPIEPSYDGTLPIPNDYIKLQAITVGDTALVKRPLEVVLKLRNSLVGTPTIFCERGQSWVLAPYPAEGTELQIDYYQEIPHLVEATDENWLSNVKPYAIIDGALVRAARHFVDRRLPDFVQAFSDDLTGIQSRATDDATSDVFMTPGFEYPSED